MKLILARCEICGTLLEQHEGKAWMHVSPDGMSVTSSCAGEVDSTKNETDAWTESPQGQETITGSFKRKANRAEWRKSEREVKRKGHK